jgi:hypothetical protein
MVKLSSPIENLEVMPTGARVWTTVRLPGTGELASVRASAFANLDQLLQVRMTALVQVSQGRMAVVH